MTTSLANHPVVSPDRWVTERKALLDKEKELTHLRDEIARRRRALPWERVTKDYVFDTPDGPRALAELFDGRRQLVVQHFMLGPDWEAGCRSCSFMADHVDGALPHLAHRDTTFVAVSRAPLPEINRFRQRMGWKFPWVSSHRNAFNFDFHVSFRPEDKVDGMVDYNYHRTKFPHDEAPGISVFWRDDAGQVFHTYSTYSRGVELMMGTYELLDITPKGRDEDGLEFTMAWVQHHDRYQASEAGPAVAPCCRDKP